MWGCWRTVRKAFNRNFSLDHKFVWSKCYFGRTVMTDTKWFCEISWSTWKRFRCRGFGILNVTICVTHKLWDYDSDLQAVSLTYLRTLTRTYFSTLTSATSHRPNTINKIAICNSNLIREANFLIKIKTEMNDSKLEFRWWNLELRFKRMESIQWIHTAWPKLGQVVHCNRS